MKKKFIVELILAIILVVTEVIVVAVMYPEAKSASSIDAYISSLLALFINIDVLYGIFIMILNYDWHKNQGSK